MRHPPLSSPMSSPGFNATIDLRLKPSLRAVKIVFGLHLVAIALVFLARPPTWAGLALALLLFISWQRLRRPTEAGYGGAALVHLIWHADSERWTLETGSGAQTGAELLGSSVVQPWLLVLNFRRQDGRRRTRIVFGDELDDEQLRRLRARLLALKPG